MGCACVKTDYDIDGDGNNHRHGSKTSMAKNKKESKTKEDYVKTTSKANLHKNRRTSNHANLIEIEIHNDVDNKSPSSVTRKIERDSNKVSRKGELTNKEREDRRSLHVQSAIVNHPISEPYMISRVDPDFNFPIVGKLLNLILIEDIYVGTGLKRMEGYISKITKEDLDKKREAFWGTRVEGNPDAWQFLQTICTSDDIRDEDIKEYLNAVGIKPYKDCINITYDTKGVIYEIPNYCIHDPYKYEFEEVKRKICPGENIIEVIIRSAMRESVYELLNTSTVGELKVFITSSYEQGNINIEDIRLFFSGKELANEEELWFYNIEDKSIVNMLIR